MPDPVLEVATAVNVPDNLETDGCNATGGNELSEPIPILRTKFSTLENTECYFFQAGMSTNYYCTVECDNGQIILDSKRVWGDSFCVFCRERLNILQEKLNICINCFNRKEVATTDTETYAEAAKNVEATFVDILEATIKKMKVEDLKEGLKSHRILYIVNKVELQDRLIHAIKDKVHIGDFLDNTIG